MAVSKGNKGLETSHCRNRFAARPKAYRSALLGLLTLEK
jgi:hypothetical protein